MYDEKNDRSFLDKIYQHLGEWGHKVIILIYFLTAILIIIEGGSRCGFLWRFIWPLRFIKHFEKLVDFQLYATIGAMLGVVWTCSITLVVFYLGRLDHREYGVRLVDILVTDLGYRILIELGITFFVELVFLITTIWLEYPLAFVLCAIYQFIAVVYIFLIICMESSTRHVRDKIMQMIMAEMGECDETKEKNDKTKEKNDKTKEKNDKKNILSQVIYSANLENPQERDTLIYLHSSIVKRCRSDMACHSDTMIYDFSEIMMEMIINATSIKSLSGEMAILLLKQTDNENAGRGILSSVLQYMDDNNIDMVLKTEFQNQQELLLWGMAYCMFYSQREDKKFLRLRAKRIKQIFSTLIETKQEDPLEKLIVFWAGFVKENQDDYKRKCDLQYDLFYELLNS